MAKRSPFDYVKSVSDTKEYLLDKEQHDYMDTIYAYNPFIVNRALSYHTDSIMIVNEMNGKPHLNNQMQYDFLFHILKKRKRYSKWAKPPKYEHLEMVQKYYKYNRKKALEVLDILSEKDLSDIEKYLDEGGIKKGRNADVQNG